MFVSRPKIGHGCDFIGQKTQTKLLNRRMTWVMPAPPHLVGSLGSSLLGSSCGLVMAIQCSLLSTNEILMSSLSHFNPFRLHFSSVMCITHNVCQMHRTQNRRVCVHHPSACEHPPFAVCNTNTNTRMTCRRKMTEWCLCMQVTLGCWEVLLPVHCC